EAGDRARRQRAAQGCRVGDLRRQMLGVPVVPLDVVDEVGVGRGQRAGAAGKELAALLLVGGQRGRARWLAPAGDELTEQAAVDGALVEAGGAAVAGARPVTARARGQASRLPRRPPGR